MTSAFWPRYLAAIVTVCAVLWGMAIVARRLRGGSIGPSDGLRKIASLALAPDVSVYVVRAGGRDFLVAPHGSVCALEAVHRTDRLVQ